MPLPNLTIAILLFLALHFMVTTPHENTVYSAEAQPEHHNNIYSMSTGTHETMGYLQTTSYYYPFASSVEGEDNEVEMLSDNSDGLDTTSAQNRRSLFWQRMHGHHNHYDPNPFHHHHHHDHDHEHEKYYYISYAALSANRIPCPPRSGRSYYTNNCYRARGPVHPYSRNCEAITHCRR